MEVAIGHCTDMGHPGAVIGIWLIADQNAFFFKTRFHNGCGILGQGIDVGKQKILAETVIGIIVVVDGSLVLFFGQLPVDPFGFLVQFLV